MESTDVKIIGGVVLGSLLLIAAIAFLGSSAGPKDSIDPAAAVGDAAHVKGVQGEGAPATIVEFADFQCPACAAAHPAVKQMVKENSDTVRYIFRHFPLVNIHPNAQPAAYAAEAAGKQNKFWEVHDWLFENQKEWGEAEVSAEYFYEEFGEEFELEKDQFVSDFDSEEVRQPVADDFAAGRELDVTSTPTFFVNGKRVTGVQSADDWGRLLQEAQSQ